ncbi:UDP-N-acetylglucosamine 1-carboxyvinyltransferase [Desulfocucumis palustris]|uniref:UDP-N-acetylglucosamine 1-carboxyvinyltransferase n=1 Tax=Desulfocucumis palustris TaxID=1898651 RepID=A0A2L2XB13_9FIRM|nr:UDP-N-acetylglucosamine 1-carboxyvinyltransferase [Desulfocucumis palustris]GBF33479.1 UDP-N-acetylglucosamine 1-carboxyvinyltransferase [Desulfocucumis palustris]
MNTAVLSREKIIINGKAVLKGNIKIGGAKNAALALMSAAIMADGEIILENVPEINDVMVMLEIIRSMGADVAWQEKETLKIKSPEKVNSHPPYNLVKKLRASNLLLGPMLARYGKAKVALPGGCKIGNRPMDLHFKGLCGLGAQLELDRGYIKAEAGGLQGARVYLDFPSVGATENLMMAACLAQGQTVIENVAKEPEIVDLANFLNCLGAKVRGAGTDVIKIQGVDKLSGCSRYCVIPDRIEAGTFMVAAAATGGDVTLENVISTHLEPVSAKLREANVEITEDEDTIRVKAGRPLKPIDIKTMPYPGFPTDLQSQMMAMLTTIPGTSIITENIFENRFQVADELKRLGANIKVEGRLAVIEGVQSLQGTQVKATDLRAGAALVVAALTAAGTTEIYKPDYIYRGYHQFEKKLKQLGADITSL